MTPPIDESSGNRAHGELQRVLETLGRLRQPLWIFDIDEARVFWANASALGIWRAGSLEELRARDMRADMSPAVARRLQQYQLDFARDPQVAFSEVWTIYPGGVPRPLEVVFTGFTLEDGRTAMLCEARQERADDPENLRSSEALMHTPVMITLYSDAGRPLYRNPAARSATPDPELSLAEHFVNRADHARLLVAIEDQGEARLVARVKTRAGERWHEVTASRCRDAVTGGVATLVSEVDVDELKTTEARARYLAQHDVLTGLPNRSFVADVFRERLDRARREGKQAALIFIDLDHFKHINDTLGHAMGDKLLVQIAQRLRGMMRTDDIVARLGGDEFLVFAAAPRIRDSVEALTNRLQASIARVTPVGDTSVRVTPSMGISLFPLDGSDLDTLMRHADLAMYAAKAAGRNQVAYFNPQLVHTAQTLLTLKNEIGAALEQDQLEVYYQPRLNVRDNRIVGAEALVRWIHPTRGLVPASEFIPVCEDSGHMAALGAFVLEQAARQQRLLAALGHNLRLSVNLSPRQISDPHFLSSIHGLLSETGCDPRRLEFEITESALLGHNNQTRQVLDRLVEIGFRLSIDDFGTGYSNLAYLQRFPVHALKIDRSFVVALDRSPAIPELILTMCKMLGIDTVAEGVERPEQLAWLAERGCHEYQGYLFSPAVPAQELIRMLG